MCISNPTMPLEVGNLPFQVLLPLRKFEFKSADRDGLNVVVASVAIWEGTRVISFCLLGSNHSAEIR